MRFAFRYLGAWPPGPARRVMTIGSLVLLAIAAGAVVVRSVTPRGTTTIFLVAGSPYWMLLAVPGLMAALAGRNWLLTVVGLVVIALAASTQARLYTASAPPVDGVRITVMTANLHLGGADPGAVVAEVRRHNVGVLMLEELTEPEQRALAGAGLDALLGYHASLPAEGGRGTGIWSRYPLRGVAFPARYAFAMVRARMTIPGLAWSPTLLALHMAGPTPVSRTWQQDMTRLHAMLGRLPVTAPVVVGGDFNATNDEIQFRRLLTGGYADAADQAGAGYTRTYPSNRWFPPLLAIDHVLTRDAVATSAETVQIPGSDHRALLVRVAIPRPRRGR